MNCHYCPGSARLHGRDRAGNQRYRCRVCGKTFQEDQDRPLGTVRIPKEKALLILQLLLEGNTIRGVARILDVHKGTVLHVLSEAGHRCRRMMDHCIRNMPVEHIEMDEMWGFIAMKARTKKKLGIRNKYIGDAWIYTAVERHSKAIVAWHLGQRDNDDTVQFLEKIGLATVGEYQLSSDAWPAYADNAHRILGTRASLGTITKIFRQVPGPAGRYSPPQVIAVRRAQKFGHVDKIGTSAVERMNLTTRQQVRRLARLTLSYSKKWENLQAMLGLFYAHFNWCRVHSAHRVTPLMEAGLEDHVFSLEELLEKSATFN